MAKIDNYQSPKNVFGIYEDPVKGLLGKKFEVNGWIVSEFVIKELVPVVGYHPYPLTELFLLTSICCWYKPKFIFEWGTNVGKSARIFHEINSKFGLSMKIYTFDLPNASVHPELPKEDQLGYYINNIREINLIRGDGITESLKIINEKKIKNAKLLFFLDGDHSYKSVFDELTNIYSDVKHACVVVHDTFNQTSKSKYNLGPHLAVKSFLSLHKDHHVLAEASMSLPGITALL